MSLSAKPALFLAALLLAALAVMASPASAEEEPGAAPPPEDLLTLARGAVLVSASVNPAGAVALTDGNPASNWNSSTRRKPPPYIFVFELAAPATLSEVGIDGSGPRPGGVQGGSAGPVLIEGSAESAETGFRELARIEAAADGPTLAGVDGAAVRWLKFTIEGGQTPEVPWIYFDEVLAFGEMVSPEASDRFTGKFQTARANFVELKQDGASVTGCYVENSGLSSGTLSGAVSDGVARLVWTSDQGVTGTAFFTRDSEGALYGVRYRQNSRSVWAGPPAPDDTTTPCSDGKPANPVAEALEQNGEVRIYGILFEYDSDVPKPSSAAALRQLLEALELAPGMNVEIEGHTDSDGNDGYNLDLSERRAASVVNWLTERSIAAERLTSSGKGETLPVASNDTADGKALNRRVEVRRTN